MNNGYVIELLKIEQQHWTKKTNAYKELQQAIKILSTEGKVLAEGIVRMYPSGCEVGDKTLSDVNKDIFAYKNQSIKVKLQLDK